MKNRKIILTLLVFALVISANIQPAIAYFTTYTYAVGGCPIYLRDTTRIEETFSQRVKHIRISSDANSEPVWVRAKVFFAYQGVDSVVVSSESGKWVEGEKDENGYVFYYYTEPLLGGEKTDELTATINFKEGVTPAEGDNFNVIVIYESTPVRYSDTTYTDAKWNAALIDSKTLEG